MGGRSPPTTVNSSVRTREYLTTAEIERLMVAATKSSRYGHRDATMILIGYRHGLRASELCDLQWSQVELTTGPATRPQGEERLAECPSDESRRTREIRRNDGAAATSREGHRKRRAGLAVLHRRWDRALPRIPESRHLGTLRCGCSSTSLRPEERQTLARPLRPSRLIPILRLSDLRLPNRGGRWT